MGDTWESYRLKNLGPKSCYIAGKIKDCLNYEELFEQAKIEVAKLALVPISPLDLHGDLIKYDHLGLIQKSLEFMKTDVTILVRCSNVYALNNWQKSNGATIEIGLARYLNLNIIYQPLPIDEEF